ncbi:MAG: type II secretion system F family protein, partial [Spirochaetota bacterium]
MIYEYQAIDSRGKTVTDIIDAPNPIKAREKLRSQGFYVVKISPRMPGADRSKLTAKKGSLAEGWEKLNDYFAEKTCAKQVGLFSRQLATLLGAGLPLLRAISDILEQTDNQNFKQIVADLKEKLEEGMSFSNSLARHRKVFSDMYINMVKVGENLGSLDTVIERLADIEEKNNILKSKVQSALWYPAFMIFFSVLVVIFMMVKIIPSLSSMFIEMGRELPLPTKIVMGISSFLTSFWWVILLASVGGVYFFKRYISTPKGRAWYDQWLLEVPLFKALYRKQIVLKFTQNLGVLLDNNVDILKSFEIVKKIVGNSVIEKKIEEAAVKVKEGTPVSKALARADFLPKLVIGMISAGEASDSLDEMLIKIGKVYETELDLTISSITSIIEPVIIIMMGGAIGLIVISVMLP